MSFLLLLESTYVDTLDFVQLQLCELKCNSTTGNISIASVLKQMELTLQMAFLPPRNAARFQRQREFF